jgi:hypothetical protein
MVAPMGGAMVLVLSSSAVLEAAGLSRYVWGQYVEAAVAIPLVIAGMVLTVVRSQRRRPELELHVVDQVLSLREPGSGRVLVTAPIAEVGATRCMHRFRARGMIFDHPGVELRISGRQNLTLGIYDARYGWRDTTAWLPLPRYIVSAEDWSSLVGRLGLSEWIRGPG